jgi:hypothetical protein
MLGRRMARIEPGSRRLGSPSSLCRRAAFVDSHCEAEADAAPNRDDEQSSARTDDATNARSRAVAEPTSAASSSSSRLIAES